MNKGNFFRRTVSTLFIVSIMLFASVTHAEIYTGEGSYIMSEGENLGVAKERAKADAMRNAAEKAGTYVKSYSRSKNFELEEDIIETMTANIIKLIGNPNFLPYEQLDNLEGLLIRVIVKVQIDDSDINRWLNKDEQQKSELVSQNEALRKANEEQARQIAELKRQLANNPQDREQITKKFEVEDKIFLSNQKVEEGTRLAYQDKLDEAIKLYTEAIEINPNNVQAYYERGVAYSDADYNNEKLQRKAIADFTQVIQLKPSNDEAYYKRALAYWRLEKRKQAIAEYSKAIELNPDYYKAYYNRAMIYHSIKQYKLAVQDYTKLIQHRAPYNRLYEYRAYAYYYLKQYNLAVQDFTQELQGILQDYERSILYSMRGKCYEELGESEKAQADFAKAKELGYNG